MTDIKFKKGDRVRRIGKDWGDVVVGEVYTVVACGEYGVDIKEGKGTIYDPASFELISPLPNPRHIHADLIIAWAEGEEIEVLSPALIWRRTDSPQWSRHSKYRIKPKKNEKDLQIEKLEESARDILSQIEKLKGE